MARREFRTDIKDDALWERITSTINSLFNGSKIDFLASSIDCLVSQGVNTQIDLTEDEKKIVETAINVSGLSYEHLLKRGLLAECKREMSLVEHREKLSTLDDSALLNSTIRGAASLRIKKAIDAIIHHNEHVTEKEDKIYISESIVFRITGSNRGAIRQFFEQNQEMIDTHNKKYGLDDSVNRKGKGYDFKATLGL